MVFVALQNKRPTVGTLFGNQAGSSTQPVMTVSLRLEGPTSSSALVNVITGTVVPRTTALLVRLRGERDRRATERRLREQQDLAYAEAGRRDQERVRAKQAEMAEQAHRAEEQARRLRIAAERREQRKRDEQARCLWCAWAAHSLLPSEPAEGTPGALTIGFRLGTGRRVVRRFLADEPLESLYVFVELQSATVAPTDSAEPLPEGYNHQYRFKLSTAMPRRILALDMPETVAGFGGLDGANVNVEGTVGGAESEEEDDEDEDD